ncbi:LPS translocon maturation chaperone LptM [Colwellia psychrerythraea]|uniref:Lipoprotein n=1 Tax=Colwellia psychrerythraea TaxID=28229 RepID=A0A099KRK8_COLPS|nr:lipoprotein [Colwellia psychrerythraea]KGJ92517.1 hypothetical protein ND2E_2765 [Colwellia psychrerythraea]
MCTNRLHNLQQKLEQKLQLKSILLACVAITFLSACGIKGDLYQTPEQAVSPKNEVATQGVEKQNESTGVDIESQPVTTLNDSPKKQAVQQSVEQTEAATSQSTDPVKESQ